MAQDSTPNDAPREDTAPVPTEDAVDETLAEEESPVADAEPEDPEAEAPVAPVTPDRPAPVGAQNVTDALRTARAEQRLADSGEASAPATPAAVAPLAPAGPGEPAGDALVAEALAEEVPPEAAPEAAATEAPPEGTAPTYDAFVASLDDVRRALIDQHITGLKRALQAERATVKQLDGQAKTAQALADDKTRLEAAMAAQAVDAQLATHRADFYEHAIDQGVRRKSVRLAYLAALDAGHLGDDGTIGWEAMRAQFSDLFESPGRNGPIPPSRSTTAAAGAGSRGDTPAAPTLNQIIRNAAGRR